MNPLKMPRKINKIDKEFAEKVKEISEVDEALNELLRMEFKSPTLENLRETYFNKISHFPIVAMNIEKAILAKFEVFRARVIDEKIEDITTVSTFGAPPPQFTKDIGRANWPYKPVFYGADTPYGASSELKQLENGKEFYLSKWHFNLSEIQNQYIPVSTLLFGNMSKSNPWQIMMAGKRDLNDEWIEGIGQEKADSLSYLNDQMCKLFTTPSNKFYPITAFIAHQYIYSDAPEKNEVTFPILVYPSLENKLNSCNYAIHPGFVQTYMYPSTFMHVKITDCLGKGLKVSCKKIGTCKDGRNIQWYEIKVDTSSLEYSINFVGCPSSGRLYYPDEYNDLKFTLQDKTISINELVEEILNHDREFVLDNLFALPNNFISDMEFPTVQSTKIVLTSRKVTTVEFNGNTYVNPHFNIDAITKLNYKPLNIKGK